MGMKVKMFLGAQIYGEAETTENFFKGVAWDWTPGPIVETASPLGLLETLPQDHGVTTKKSAEYFDRNDLNGGMSVGWDLTTIVFFVCSEDLFCKIWSVLGREKSAE